MQETLETRIQQLYAADAHTRSQAALQLGEQRESRAVEALVQVLCSDTDLNVQEDATWALVRMGETAVGPLLAALDHENAQVRHNIVHALGKLGDSRALDGLITATSDPDAKVRNKAVYALGQLGDPRALETLVARLDDPVQDIAWQTREVVEGFGDHAIPALIAALEAESNQMRELAASLLGDLEATAAVETLMVALKTDDAEVQLAVIQALGQIGDPRAVAAIEPFTTAADPRLGAMARAMLKGLAAT